MVDFPGDNLVAAVRCAVEIHEELRGRNDELPENRRMEFRIGINLGDVVAEGERIYGDGVNIAARVEGLAEGGGICISGTVYDSIKNKLSLSYESLGERIVKNIKEPIRVYRMRIGPEAAAQVIREKKLGQGAGRTQHWQLWRFWLWWVEFGQSGTFIWVLPRLQQRLPLKKPRLLSRLPRCHPLYPLSPPLPSSLL